MKHLAIPLALAVVASQPAAALAQGRQPVQAVAETERQGLGASVSWIAGSGLTYFRTFPNGWGFHVAGVGWGQGSSGFWNVGGAITKEFNRTENASLYGLLATGAGLSLFSGMGGLGGGTSPQVNIAPGIGLTYGPLFVEGGMSFYYNGQFGYQPAIGTGLIWWF